MAGPLFDQRDTNPVLVDPSLLPKEGFYFSYTVAAGLDVSLIKLWRRDFPLLRPVSHLLWFAKVDQLAFSFFVFPESIRHKGYFKIMKYGAINMPELHT